MLVAVTIASILLPTSEPCSVYLELVAPEMFEQRARAVLPLVGVGGRAVCPCPVGRGEGLALDGLAADRRRRTVRRSWGRRYGCGLGRGGELDPPWLVAVTTTRTVFPTRSPPGCSCSPWRRRCPCNEPEGVAVLPLVGVGGRAIEPGAVRRGEGLPDDRTSTDRRRAGRHRRRGQSGSLGWPEPVAGGVEPAVPLAVALSRPELFVPNTLVASGSGSASAALDVGRDSADARVRAGGPGPRKRAQLRLDDLSPVHEPTASVPEVDGATFAENGKPVRFTGPQPGRAHGDRVPCASLGRPQQPGGQERPGVTVAA